jgi:hypothetical protein
MFTLRKFEAENVIILRKRNKRQKNIAMKSENDEENDSNKKMENHPLVMYGCDDMWTFSKCFMLDFYHFTQFNFSQFLSHKASAIDLKKFICE